ncbi:MAG: hypothetical protein KA740_10565 [Rhodoferax sp.]|jgi:hypothetical protein|nr:hypothetical protein [Rhodoferax sp.]
MIFSLKNTAAIVISLGLAQGAVLAQTAADNAAQAVDNGVKGSGHASASAAHSIAASGQVTSGMMAVPLLASGAVAGSAGGASANAGATSLNAASMPIGTPLVVTDESITVMPPNQALKSKTEPNKQ